METPAISIIIPCGDDTDLPETLDSIAAQQDTPSFEVVIADSCDHDLSAGLEQWKDRLDICVIKSRGGANPGANRNAAVAVSRGSLLVFVDADDIVAEGYLGAMARALGEHEIVCSLLDFSRLNSWADANSRPEPVGLEAPDMEFLPFVGAGTLGIRRSLFEEIGGFDVSLRRYQEADLCWRIQLSGYDPPTPVPDAILHYRLQRSRGQLSRKIIGQGQTQALLYKRYRHAGMPRERIRDSLSAWRAILIALLRRMMGRPMPGLGWQLAMRLGRLLGSVRHRVAYF